MHPNQELLEKFYSSFAQQDGNSMADCYHESIKFSDPVFPNLEGDEAGSMWKMLCEQAKNFRLTYKDIVADEDSGSAYWEATYDFSATGRRVHNKIYASFKFKDGKIIEHDDYFDFWRWSRMALGPAGLLMGWTPMVKNKVRGMAGKSLKRYMASKQ